MFQRWPSADYEEDSVQYYGWIYVYEQYDQPITEDDLYKCNWNDDQGHYDYTTQEVPEVGSVVFEQVLVDSNGVYLLDADPFRDVNLSAWQLKYCLDNDVARFSWALQGGHGPFKLVSQWDEDPAETYYIPYVTRAKLSELSSIVSYMVWDSDPLPEGFSMDTEVDWYTDDNRVIIDPSFGVDTDVYTLEYTGQYDDVAMVKLTAWLEQEGLQLVEASFEPDIAPGTGVIFGMIDQNGNKAGYDFKNILFLDSYNVLSYTFNDSYSGPVDGSNDLVRNCQAVISGELEQCTIQLNGHYIVNCLLCAGSYALSSYAISTHINNWIFSETYVGKLDSSGPSYLTNLSTSTVTLSSLNDDIIYNCQTGVTSIAVTHPQDYIYREYNHNQSIEFEVRFTASQDFDIVIPQNCKFVGSLSVEAGKSYRVSFCDWVYYIYEIQTYSI